VPASGTLGGRYFAVLLETDLRVFFDFEGRPQGNLLRAAPVANGSVESAALKLAVWRYQS
jgi:hypothetical protein